MPRCRCYRRGPAPGYPLITYKSGPLRAGRGASPQTHLPFPRSPDSPISRNKDPLGKTSPPKFRPSRPALLTSFAGGRSAGLGTGAQWLRGVRCPRGWARRQRGGGLGCGHDTVRWPRGGHSASGLAEGRVGVSPTPKKPVHVGVLGSAWAGSVGLSQARARIWGVPGYRLAFWPWGRWQERPPLPISK